jgi:hypothetical protein
MLASTLAKVAEPASEWSEQKYVYTPLTVSVLLNVLFGGLSLSSVGDAHAVAPPGITADTTSWALPSGALFQVTVSPFVIVMFAALN